MRRFRTTWLRKQRAPEDLIKLWLGHAEQSVTDGYSKLAEDVEFRKEVTEKLGTGFEIPAYEEKPVIPMRPRKTERNRVGVVLKSQSLLGIEWRARRESNSRPFGS
jgi:hypothetical protein